MQNAKSEGKAIRKLADGGGLYLWVYADGRKYWRLRYWLGGKEKSLSLGVYPDVGLKAARTKRETQRKHLDNSLDPSAERTADKLMQQWADYIGSVQSNGEVILIKTQKKNAA